MTTVEIATQTILENLLHLGTESVAIELAVERVLQEPLVADRDMPPFDRVTMDGIAIQWEAFENGHRFFPIESVAAAGAPRHALKVPLHCIETMTGTMLPAHTDTVIRYEDLKIENGIAQVQTESVKCGQNVHRRGEDCTVGTTLVPPGRVITAAEIGIAATVGKSQLLVTRQPKILILSSGDELVGVGDTPLPHQIRMSNSLTLQAMLASYRINANCAHLPDDASEISVRLSAALESYHVLLLSGGVSEGKFDYVHRSLESLGVEKLFHKVSQRPGKPFWFGRRDLPNGRRLVFAFPGNPVSTFVCAMRYFLPWLQVSLGMLNAAFPQAQLARDVNFKPDLTYFLPVKITNEGGKLLAHPVAGHGSGDLANLAAVDGFLELPKGKNDYWIGEAYPFIAFRFR
jgi:molybdopterin molybdotransferase